MVRKFGMVCGLAVGLLMCAGSAFALGPVADLAARGQHELLDVSFFGRPYPYGFTGWGPCVRYVEVPTPRGVRLRRVRVCR